ncbi:MAG: carbohydrate-binding domain-containing protein [Clostridiales bacterium]|nr:carbohydrate-binding domain-containing protein [Clostridiales bacterium]
MKRMKMVARTLILMTICLMLCGIPVSAASKTVAKIGSKSYTSLQKALDAVQNGQTIKLQKNVKIAKDEYAYTSAKKFTLDLNGYKIKGNVDQYTTYYVNGNAYRSGFLNISIGANVTIKNGTVTAGVLCNSGAKLTIASGVYKESIENRGTTIIKKGTFIGSVRNGLFESDLLTGTTVKAKMTIKGGTFQSYVSNYDPSVMTIAGGTFQYSVSNSGTMVINKGTFTQVSNYGKLTINKGTFSSFWNNGGAVTINYGVFKGDTADAYSTAIYNRYEDATMKIKDAKVTAQISNSQSAKLVITGGTFSADDKSAVIWNTSATLSIKGGTFTYTGSGTYNYAVMAGNLWDSSDTGKVTISGGTFKVTSSGAGLRVNGGTVTVKGGTFYGNGEDYGAIDVYTSSSALKFKNATLYSTSTIHKSICYWFA